MTKAPSESASDHRRSFSSWVWDWTKSILIALVIWLFLRTFIIEAFRIPSASMENTLLVGDFLFVNKALYGADIPFTGATTPVLSEPELNDIVVFHSVEAATPDLMVVKRLVGMPGDTLAMRDSWLIRNGEQVEEPWVRHDDPTRSAGRLYRAQMREWQIEHYIGDNPASYAPDLQNWGPIVVPPDSYFMMGDNRDGSYDSRYWGFVPRESIVGQPLFIYYSYNPDSWKPLPFFSAIRWGRLLSTPE